MIVCEVLYKCFLFSPILFSSNGRAKKRKIDAMEDQLSWQTKEVQTENLEILIEPTHTDATTKVYTVAPHVC